MNNPQRVLAVAAVMVLAVAGTACSSSSKKNDAVPELTPREMRLAAGELYRLARASLDSSDFEAAIQRYSQLSLRFPFTDYANQGELEKIYALYRAYDSDKAISAADKFLREHPRHPSADYVQYLKGLINAAREQSLSDIMSFGDTATKGDVSADRRAFDDFALLVQKYPGSPYVGDARQRMVYLRNRIAEHELHVVRFYVSRGAYVAAAKRAEQVIAQYPGAPATYEALEMLEACYRGAGLTQQAEDARRILAAQPPRQTATAEQASEGWFDNLFRERTITLPTGKPATVAPPALPADGEPAGAAPAAAPAATSGAGSRLSVTMEPYDDAPADQQPAGPEASPPAPAETTPSTAPGDPNTAPAPPASP